MQYSADSELAMILPLPTPPNSPEDAVQFIDLSGYRDFFDDLHDAFPAYYTKGYGSSLKRSRGVDSLKVHDVGDFEASFVPTLADFRRLDKRFKLPEGTFEQIPQYSNYGFAIFKLKPGADTKTHPMAFSFPCRQRQLFFPTVHIHDIKVHEWEKFDHSLYFQGDNWDRDKLSKQISAGSKRPDYPANYRADVSGDVMRHYMDAGRTNGILDGGAKAYLIKMRGEFKNEDVWVN
jgi:hypothetical protein